jgi:molybdate transport system regulatory protein
MTKNDNDSFPVLTPNYKLWLEHKGKYVFGPGAYALLMSIKKNGSIAQAAKEQKMSYRYAWGVIRKIERVLDASLIESYKGGHKGGGGARLTAYGLSLMGMYSRVSAAFASSIESLR